MNQNLFQKFLKNPRYRHLFLAIFFLFFALVVTIFQNILPNISENNSSQNISQSGSAYIETLQEETRAKVLAILDDAEVQKTLERIAKSDEYYRKDGAVFMNREKRLPVKSDKSYYAEWTVKTPGENDRGARRVVVGKGGEMYFTDDHYETFIRIQ